MSVNKVFLDPDYRRDPDTSLPYCCRCQKVIKGKGKGIKVSVDFSSLGGAELVMLNSDGDSLIGSDCAKIIGLIDERGMK